MEIINNSYYNLIVNSCDDWFAGLAQDWLAICLSLNCVNLTIGRISYNTFSSPIVLTWSISAFEITIQSELFSFLNFCL